MPDTQPAQTTITRTQRPITYRCEWCGRERTELRFPGPRPRYCPECKQPAQNSIAMQRMRELRKRQAEANPPTRGPGRPKES